MLLELINTENDSPFITDPAIGGSPEPTDFSNIVYDSPQADDNACFCVEK
jgi:hypothetical protein